jgi:carbamoyltransferase
MGTELDILLIGNCFLKKDVQDQSLRLDYKDGFELD